MTPDGSTYIPIIPGKVLVAGRGQDPEGREFEPHRHPEGQLIGSLKGLLSIGTDANVWVVPAIHAVWLPPHQTHSVRSHGPMDGWTVYVTEEACRGLSRTPCTIRTSGLLREAVLRAATWAAGPMSAVDHRIASVILDEIGGLPVEPFSLSLPRDPRMLRVAQALMADPADARGIADWAALASASERTLSRHFVEETGFNFTDWRQRARLLRSLEMLANGQPVTTIALDLGYATASAFIAMFRRLLGETPKSYRTKLLAMDRT
jgi:AraC-like DNA-binding protein